MEELGTKIAQVLTDFPIGVTIGKSHLYIYPITIGKMYLTSQLIENLNIDKKLLEENPFMEALRLATTKRETCSRLIAYHTINKKKELQDEEFIKKQQETILSLDNEDIASLLIIVLTNTNKPLSVIIQETGIEEENKRMAKVNAAKKSDSQYVFGGKTIWGSLIDAACERYGWTYDYVVWGISYNNLTLMLKDKITSIYLSDEEKKRGHVAGANEKVLNGNNIEDVLEAIRESDAGI